VRVAEIQTVRIRLVFQFEAEKENDLGGSWAVDYGQEVVSNSRFWSKSYLRRNFTRLNQSIKASGRVEQVEW
jgi:hypothetical protein